MPSRRQASRAARQGSPSQAPRGFGHAPSSSWVREQIPGRLLGQVGDEVAAIGGRRLGEDDEDELAAGRRRARCRRRRRSGPRCRSSRRPRGRGGAPRRRRCGARGAAARSGSRRMRRRTVAESSGVRARSVASSASSFAVPIAVIALRFGERRRRARGSAPRDACGRARNCSSRPTRSPPPS